MTLRKPAVFSCIAHKAASVLGIVFSALLVPILILNLTLMYKARVDPDHVPAVCGYVPMAILTNSMDPTIVSGDLVIYQTVDTGTLAEGEVIAFYDPASTQRAVVTHRISSVDISEDGTTTFTTKGDANVGDDTMPVPTEDVIGVYHARIPKLGNLVLFMQTTKGILLFVVLPLLLLMSWDRVRKFFEEHKATLCRNKTHKEETIIEET